MPKLTELLMDGVREVKEIGPAVVKLLADLAPEILAAKGSPAELEKIAETLVTDGPAIAEAVKANTPSATPAA